MVTRSQILEIVCDLPRHSILHYINRSRLDERFFRTARENLDDGYIYLVFTCSQSAASAVLRQFTHREYNHVSLAFDPELRTLLSYNGGSSSAARPGLNPELPVDLPEGRVGACLPAARRALGEMAHPTACPRDRSGGQRL